MKSSTKQQQERQQEHQQRHEHQPLQERLFKCISFMRHSIAVHNEAAATSTDTMRDVYLNEAYADASLSHAGQSLIGSARYAMAGLSPPPDVVLCSPLTRAIQTATAMFEGTGIRIVAIPEAREACGRFPCDRHRGRIELQLTFGDAVDFSLCPEKDTLWQAETRESMEHLSDRVACFLKSVLQRDEGHVFVVSHGVFMEMAIHQLSTMYPGDRVQNCEVHSFVFAASPRSPSSRLVTISSDSTSSQPSQPGPAPPPEAGGLDERKARSRPRVEAHVFGDLLAMACATKTPLPMVAHITRVLRPLNAKDGHYLAQGAFAELLARCGVSEEEACWLFAAFSQETRDRVVPSEGVAQALMAFNAGGKDLKQDSMDLGPAADWLMEHRMRHQRRLEGTPLANQERLGSIFKRILSTVLATS